MPRRRLTHLLAIAVAAPALLAPAASAATITGTPQADRLLGTAQADTIDGLAGRDRILARGGDDVVSGGAGADLLRGNAGNDAISGGDGADLITGNLGDDTLDGGAGRDAIFGGSGNDRITGGDTVAPAAAARDGFRSRGPFWGTGDRLHGGAGNDAVSGGAGRDFVSGGFGDDQLQGGDGADRIFANQGVDTIDGGNGNDDLWALSRKDVTGPGDTTGDTLIGGAGDDRFHTYDGEADRITCGEGRDRVIADVYDVIADATPENPNGSCEHVTRTRPESDKQEGATEAPSEDRQERL